MCHPVLQERPRPNDRGSSVTAIGLSDVGVTVLRRNAHPRLARLRPGPTYLPLLGTVHRQRNGRAQVRYSYNTHIVAEFDALISVLPLICDLALAGTTLQYYNYLF